MADVGQILIVGGGIAGLTLATALHQKGFRAELVELSPHWHAVGAGILVQANGMRVLHALGLGKPVEQSGAIVRRWMFCDDQGATLSETDLEELWGDTGACIGIERPRLQQVLMSGAAAVPCRLGTSVVSLKHDANHVSVKFTDGSDGEFDLVVGADGIESAVRSLALGTTSPADLGAMNWRSIVPARPSDLTTIKFLLGDGCFFGLCPVGEGHTYGFGYVMQPRLQDPVEGRRERLRQRFASFGKQVHRALKGHTERRKERVRWVPAAKYGHWGRDAYATCQAQSHVAARGGSNAACAFPTAGFSPLKYAWLSRPRLGDPALRGAQGKAEQN